MKLLYVAGAALVFAILVFSWRSNRRGILSVLQAALLLVAGVLYFSPTELYLRELDLKEAKAYLYFRDTPLPEDGSLLVKIAPKDDFYYSNEVVLQSGYNWHGELEIEIQPVGDGLFTIEERHRPTKWQISSKGELTKID